MSREHARPRGGVASTYVFLRRKRAKNLVTCDNIRLVRYAHSYFFVVNYWTAKYELLECLTPIAKWEWDVGTTRYLLRTSNTLLLRKMVV